MLTAWESLRPDKTFAGVTLAQFKLAVQASLDAREALAAAQKQVSAAQNAWDESDRTAVQMLLRVVNGVKGDPDEGDDGALYEAMGYVRKSDRKSGLKRTPKPKL